MKTKILNDFDLWFKLMQVATVALVALSGLVAFMLFVLAATINAIFVSLLISLAVAGGFLALSFAFVTAIYIGALSVTIFAISTVVFWAVVAIVITAGNILFGIPVPFSVLVIRVCLDKLLNKIK